MDDFNLYLVIRLKLTSSASCAVFALSFTPSVSIFDELLDELNSENSDVLDGTGCTVIFPFPIFDGFFPLT